ncbi:MAG: SIMPL domain-containing protein [Chitinophagaceae bacterium]
MKTILTSLAFALLAQTSMAQQGQPVYTVNPFPKTISVSGSAEMEIVPDEIYVQITLMEYQKKGESKKDLESIRTAFLAACRAIGIPDSLISIASYSGYNNYYELKKKKKGTDMLAQITYQVKFSGSRQMDELVEKLDDDATKNFQIVSTSHSKMPEFRKQLKIKAVQIAREKGLYLSEAIGEKLGEAITINEPAEWQPYFMSSAQSNMLMRDQASPEGGSQIDFKKMKLRFEVNVVFALK